MKKSAILLFFVCAGIVIGSLVALLAEGVPYFSWLAFGMNFGLTSPFVLNLGVLTLTFGATFNLTISVIIFTTIALFLAFYLLRKHK